jgi:hypothetical protein
MTTDIDQTLKQIEIIFQKMVMDMLGLLEGSPIDYSIPAYFVRVAWPTEGAPAWKITEDIVFLRVVEEDHPVNRERDVENTRIDDVTLNEKTSYTRIISLAMVFYGPNSFDKAQLVRDGVFKDTYRLSLAQDKIYPIPDIIAPKRFPEAFQGRWWERTDLEIRFNEGVKKNQEISVIESAEIVLNNENGQVSDSTVVTI